MYKCINLNLKKIPLWLVLLPRVTYCVDFPQNIFQSSEAHRFIECWSSSRVLQVQCYDPVSDRWSYVSSCPFSQRSISAVTLNGCIYVTGGLLDQIYCYRPVTDSWSQAAALPVKLVRHSLSVHWPSVTHTLTWPDRVCVCVFQEGSGLTVCDGKVYVVGGRNEHSVAVDQVWALDPVSSKLTEEKPLTRCLSYHGCVTVLQQLWPKLTHLHLSVRLTSHSVQSSAFMIMIIW